MVVATFFAPFSAEALVHNAALPVKVTLREAPVPLNFTFEVTRTRDFAETVEDCDIPTAAKNPRAAMETRIDPLI